ncbi:hypothetical protein BT96DRAFT_917973 [Gymnopus androsaceus JB14]|uniref:Uncharacterized protein n=1 Tax=Gymnopus androsaceus JB14 TaxID=1447944 RepID=A0A6A4HTX1_9AGAR|nr:hypothetical protein BT96DRAFT_917973 [Gymnopus androsaceus JB14]
MATRRPSLNVLRQRSLTNTSSQSLHHHHTLSANLGEVEPFTIAIADIFDAPVRLGTADMRKLVLPRRPSQPAAPTPTMSPSSPSTTLPPPLVFEGPARPRSSSSLLLTKPPRNAKASENRPSSRMHHTQSPISLTFNDDVLTHMYDGPSNITRYRYSGQKKKTDDGRKPLLAAAGIATLAAGATVFFDKEESR